MVFRGLAWPWRLARRIRPVPVAAAAGGLAALAVVAFVVVQLLAGAGLDPAGKRAPATAAADLSALAALGIADSDGDGLSDASENYRYGSDPLSWDTSGSGIPDGWLARFGLDLHDPGVADRPAAAPANLPPHYRSVWPPAFQATVGDVYRFGRPASWNESAQGPFASGLDPTVADANGDGIPDGFLLHFGLDPRDGNLTTQRLAGPGGLTVLEAYRHATDPRSLDTDSDGIPDREEIDGPANPRHPRGPQRFPPSDPTRADTAGAGVCDGWLRAHGLDPGQPAPVYGDPDRDGATTREEGQWSQERFGAAACAAGKGVDPTALSTAGLAIPDGWLIHYGLDPLDPATPGASTQASGTDPGPALPAALGVVEVNLTVLDEYRHARPTSWNESRDGAWWGGTDPSRKDSDGDGLGDAWELRGYAVAVTTEPGQQERKAHLTASDPTKPDSDGDGLPDGQEADPGAAPARPTDARRADSDFDGIGDRAEAFLGLGLDPTLADTVGDFLRDGERLALLEGRAQRYAGDLTYEYPGQPTVARTVDALPSFRAAAGAAGLPLPLSPESVARLVGPLGNLDGDKDPNILDRDIDGDTLSNGWEAHPALYVSSSFGAGNATSGRPASDPLNPETDGDLLADDWEIRYGCYGCKDLPGGYNLDPSRWDTDGDGLGDGGEDPDADGIEWFSYTDAGRTPNPFEFHNLREQEHRTDPNRFDSDRDGLGDGWKVFWGRRYPSLTGADLGDVYPGTGGVVDVAGMPVPKPGVPQANVTAPSVLEYTRFVVDLSKKLPSETRVLPDAAPVPDGNGGTRTVYELEGTFPLTFLDIQAARTNPYMARASDPLSSDGDGIPDAWELLHGAVLPGAEGTDPEGCPGGSRPDVPPPDATLPDAGEDPDGDQLLNLDEFLRHSDPLCLDSDLGILEDAQEAPPLRPDDPTDDQKLLDEAKDSDGDGLLDFEELTGTGTMRRLYGRLGTTVRTDPDNPDSDGDGLLDGLTVPDPGTSAGYPRTGGSLEAVRARLFLGLGIAYLTQQGPDGQPAYYFLGEGDKTTSPVNRDDAGVGVPAGWLVAHNLPVNPAAGAYVPHYRLGMPAWWNASAGPWWGGADPAVYRTPDDVARLQRPDLDDDGLADQRGGDLFEDPMPFSNSPNAYRDVDHPELGFSPPAGATPATPGLPPTVRRLLAQAYLDPVAIGPSFLQRAESAPPAGRTTPCLEVTGLAGGNGVEKGAAKVLSGRVRQSTVPGSTQCTGDGLAGVTVEAILEPTDRRSPVAAQAFGAGFTGPQGHFAFPVNLTTQQSVPITVPGAVLRGLTSGTAAWGTDPSVIFPGTNIMAVRTYATTDAQPAPALESATATLQVTVSAGSVVTFVDPPAAAIVGEDLSIEVALADSGGTPLTDSVEVTLPGVGTATVDGGRGAALFRDIPASAAGLRILHAKSLPTSPNVHAGEASVPIRLRVPASLHLAALPGSADAGRTLAVEGQLLAGGARVAGVPLFVNVTGAGNGVAIVADSGDGRFKVPVPLPANLTFGTYALSVEAAPTDTTAAAVGGGELQVRSQPRFRLVSAQGLELGQPARVDAVLVEQDGATALANATIHIQLGQGKATARTDGQGRLNATFFPEGLAIGPVAQVLSFDGDARHTSNASRQERIVRSASALSVRPGDVARGGDASVTIALSDLAGRPLANQPVTARWGGEAAQEILTDGGGVARLVRRGAPDDPLGTFRVHARFAGSQDGTVAPSEGEASWRVRALARIDLPNGTFDAGASIPFGQLRDAGTGAALPHHVVALHIGTANATAAVTDEQGRFAVLPPVPRDADPATVEVRADYAGGPVYPPAQAAARISIRSPVDLHPHTLPTLVAGRPTIAVVDLRDARGLGVPDGTLHAALDGVPAGTAQVHDGVARIELRVPAGRPAGEARLQISFPGTATHGAAQGAAQARIVAPADLAIRVDPADPGSFATVRVTATSNGKPLPGSPVFLQVEGLQAGLEGMTDKDGEARFLVLQANQTLALSARYGGTAAISPAAASASLVPRPPFSLQDGVRLGAAIAAGAALVLAAVAYLAYRLRAHPLAPALRRARRAVRARGPHEQQILLAYQILEDAAIAHEILDGGAHTPRLLQEAVDPTLPAAVRPSLETLISLFEKARYSTQPMGPGHRDAALAALDALRRQLAKTSHFDASPRPAAGAA